MTRFQVRAINCNYDWQKVDQMIEFDISVEVLDHLSHRKNFFFFLLAPTDTYRQRFYGE